ncbi:hypothetical protein [Chryseobacterium luquanense]|uniref:F5/8 type C domain-containing protein n=1 Tax=Chryseobacterium luquanense TaxID=2983766 RepID=A0ABT3Y4L3_9FLAO|nr:hypothetical protein [Chryseobacterium luquanense]MCX8533078.1 hypothetical protein [Chryseobacterium luquanense]
MKFNILKKVNGSGSTAPKNKFAYIAHINDIRIFPQADYKGVALTDDIVMKDKTGMAQIYITPAAQEYTYETGGDSDSKNFKLKFMGTHPGTELEALEFSKNYLEEGFVVLIPSCEVGLKVLGTPDAPLVFTSSHKSDKDSQKFIFTFEQEIGTENVYQLYTGLVTLNENIDVDMGDFLEHLKYYLKLDGSNLTEAQKQNLRTLLGSDGKNLGNSDISLNENRSFNLKNFFLNFFSNVGLAKVGINKTNPSQALEVVGNIKTDGLIISDGGSPDEVGSIKRNGSEIQFKTSTGWEVIMLKGDYISDSHGMISPDTPEPVSGWKIGWYTPKLSSANLGTNYPNQDDLKSIDGFFTEFYFNGANWESISKEIPKATQFIPSFIGSLFPITGPAQRTHENSIWELGTGQTAAINEVPGISSKWNSLGSANKNEWDYSDNKSAPTMALLDSNLAFHEEIQDIGLSMYLSWTANGGSVNYGPNFGGSGFIEVFAGKKIILKFGTDADLAYIYWFDVNKQNQTLILAGTFSGVKTYEYTPSGNGYIKINSNNPATYGSPTITRMVENEIFQRKNILTDLPAGNVKLYNTENAYYGSANGEEVNVKLPLGATLELVITGIYKVNGITISNESAVLQNTGEFYILYRATGRVFISTIGRAFRYVRDWCGVDNPLTTHPTWRHIGVWRNGVNLAIGKPVSANFVPQNYAWFTVGLEEVTDGTLTDKYVAGSVSDPTNDSNWVMIDMGALTVATLIEVIHKQNLTFKFTKTEISQDGVEWQTIFDSALSGTYNEGNEGKSTTL